MTEITSTPAVEWNPLAQSKPVEHHLKVSGGRASVTLKRWSGRERLAYEDALTERMMTVDQSGESTVKIGTLRLFAVTLTVIGSAGFPPRVNGTPMFSGDRAQREDDLLALDPDTFDEIRTAALELQPLPSAGDDEPETKDADDESDLEDPSLTPSSSPTPTDAVVVPESPSGSPTQL